MGTGTTAVVAKKMKRAFIGSEISQKYIKIAQKRLLESEDLFNFKNSKDIEKPLKKNQKKDKK